MYQNICLIQFTWIESNLRGIASVLFTERRGEDSGPSRPSSYTFTFSSLIKIQSSFNAFHERVEWNNRAQSYWNLTQSTICVNPNNATFAGVSVRELSACVARTRTVFPGVAHIELLTARAAPIFFLFVRVIHRECNWWSAIGTQIMKKIPN